MDHHGGFQRWRRSHWKAALDILTSLVLMAAAVILVSFHLSNRAGEARGDLRVPSEPVAIAGAATMGSPSAPVVMIAYSDFQCPFCGRFARDVLPRIEEEYLASGRVQFVYRHLPLPIHGFAVDAAQAAECAGAQGLFWPMHDRLFVAGTQLDQAGIRAHATSLDLDAERFTSCLDRESTRAAVLRDAEEAKRLELTSTPSFLLASGCLMAVYECPGPSRVRGRLKSSAQSSMRLQASLAVVRFGKEFSR